MKPFIKQILHKTQTKFLKDYFRKEVTEYHFNGAIVETIKNYGSSGKVENVDVIVIFTDGGSIIKRYFRCFNDIRDFAVFHTKVMLSRKLDDLYTLISLYDFI